MSGQGNQAVMPKLVVAALGFDIDYALSWLHLAADCRFVVIADHFLAAFRRAAVIVIARDALPNRLVTHVRMEHTLGSGAGPAVLDQETAHWVGEADYSLMDSLGIGRQLPAIVAELINETAKMAVLVDSRPII